MPIYEYQCNACGYEFETLQKVSEEPLKDCPECTEAELQKLVSAAGFRLKGSGWYETDFKKKGKKKNLADSKPEKNKTQPKSEDKKTEKKKAPAAKSSD